MEGELKEINKGRLKINLSQIGVMNFRSTIWSHVVVTCKLFIFPFVLLLRRMGWKELIGHAKDRGKEDLNSRTNSLQSRENDAD